MPEYRRRRGLTIASTCLTAVCFAQGFQVKSVEGLRALPFASVLDITKGQLYFTDETGVLASNLTTGDSVFVTYVGYKSLRTKISAPNQTFLLAQADALLDPVHVASCKDGVKQQYSNLAADTSGEKFGGVCCWPKGATNARFAVMLRPDLGNVRLNAFSIWIERAFGAPGKSVQTPLLFSFYGIDEATMLPGELLLNQPVVYYPKKKGKQTIDVDSLRVRIQRPGIYVSIEFVYNENYEWPGRYIDRAKGIDSAVMQFGSRLDGVFSKDFTLAFYDYAKNTWFFASHTDKTSLLHVHGTIKFAADLTVCREQTGQTRTTKPRVSANPMNR